jgi:hypothetical protein
LTAYLSSGKPVYFEGGDFGYSNSTTELWPYLGTSYLGDGLAGSTGNVQNLTGAAGSFVDGLDFGYQYQQGPDNYVDEFGAAGGTVFYSDQSAIGRAVYYAGDGYRTIVSAVIFGALGPGDESGLMSGYMDYLVTGTGVLEGPGPALTGRLTATPNPVLPGGSVRINLPFRTNGTLTVFDAFGRAVREQHVSGTSADVGLRDMPAGTYFALLTGTNGSHNLSFVVTR